MPGTPKWKVFDEQGTYIASVADAHLAAALVGSAGSEGWTVKLHGRIVWREGETVSPTYARVLLASESFDEAAHIMNTAAANHAREAQDRWAGVR